MSKDYISGQLDAYKEALKFINVILAQPDKNSRTWAVAQQTRYNLDDLIGKLENQLKD